MDINIKRVLLYSFQLPVDTPLYALQELALSLVPLWKSREWHNALMDYWSAILHSKATGIRSAPQSTFVWSDREVRGWILKQLAQHDMVEMHTIETTFPTKNIKDIVAWLQKEWIIALSTDIITILE